MVKGGHFSYTLCEVNVLKIEVCRRSGRVGWLLLTSLETVYAPHLLGFLSINVKK